MSALTGGPFINEIHYDPTGTDSGEFIEVCFPAGTDATGFTVALYNGNNSGVYATRTVTDFASAVDPVDGNTYYMITGTIQNGAPDGMALVNNAGVVCEFISYEGVITAASGPASGMVSTDIMASENAATLGTSMQRQPDGTWISGVTQTPNAMNICFLEGTQIRTKYGYKNIEALKVGERILTPDGRNLPIKWIGIQSKDPESTTGPLTTNPVLIKENAISKGVPFRDLYVSPNHAVHIDGLLINAGALVNDKNIIQTNPLNPFKYYHIELDTHELILAEGLEAESYLPQYENRTNFDNAHEYELQYPGGSKIILWPLDYPRISSKHKVPNFIVEKVFNDFRNERSA